MDKRKPKVTQIDWARIQAAADRVRENERLEQEWIKSIKLTRGKPGDCFRSAFLFIRANPDWILAHGIPLGTGGNAKGTRYGHAWVEGVSPTGMTVAYDPSARHNPGILPAVIYRYGGSIEYSKLYTLSEAEAMLKKYDHYGPWDPKIWAANGR